MKIKMALKLKLNLKPILEMDKKKTILDNSKIVNYKQ